MCIDVQRFHVFLTFSGFNIFWNDFVLVKAKISTWNANMIFKREASRRHEIYAAKALDVFRKFHCSL